MYQLLLVACDGEYVTDCEGQTVDEVWNQANELGSRWIFYPFRFVIKKVDDYKIKNEKIVDAGEFEQLNGIKVQTLLDTFKNVYRKLKCNKQDIDYIGFIYLVLNDLTGVNNDK
jgi:hypothetical protein